MEARVDDDVVRLGGNARERFYDSRGYGEPDGDGLRLDRVEAAHLLYRGDLDSVDGMGFREFLASAPELATRFLVYTDLRDRGFYLSPVRWTDADPARVDLLVYPRGSGPWDNAVEHRVRVVGERASVPAPTLGGIVLAVVDEESALTYLKTTRPDVAGRTETTLSGSTPATLLDDRVVLWDPPQRLYEASFFGQPLDEDGTTLQLSLLEATYLAERDAIRVGDGADAVRERGRELEGDRFDRRLTVYDRLRAAGVVPKTGFKFGADFRTYAEVDSVDDLGHSELLVRVLPGDHVFSPRDLALDVRLAHGVRKRMMYAVVDEDIEWLEVGRVTP